MGKDTSFDVEFRFEARAVGRMRSEVDVRMVAPWEKLESMATDEDPSYGGEGTAPTPLHTFTTSLAACLMTQIRVLSRRMKIPIGQARMDGRTRWIARSEDRAPHVSEPLGFEIDITLDSAASHDDQRRLVAAAQRACFIEQSLRPEILTHRLRLGDQWVQV